MGLSGPKPRFREFIWTSDFAYAVGLITTDGCLSNDKRHMTLVSADIEQIENFKKCLNLKVKTGIHYSGRRFANTMAYRVQWGDVALYNFLLGIGLMPNKSLKLKELLIPDIQFFHYLRGCFDGDGSFYSYYDPRWKNSFMFYVTFESASDAYTKWLQRTIQRLAGVKGHVSTKSGMNKNRNTMHSLRYAKNESVILLQKLYEHPGEIYLSRKKLKIEAALRIVGKSLPMS